MRSELAALELIPARPPSIFAVEQTCDSQPQSHTDYTNPHRISSGIQLAGLSFEMRLNWPLAKVYAVGAFAVEVQVLLKLNQEGETGPSLDESDNATSEAV